MTKKEMENKEKCLRMFDLEYSVCASILAERSSSKGSASSDYLAGNLKGMADAFFKLSLIDYDTFHELSERAINFGFDF